MKRGLVLTMLVAVGSLLIFWIPFLLRSGTMWGIMFGNSGMDTVVRNFDGLNYLVVAKTWYDPEQISRLNESFLTGNSPIYFSAHFPGLPAVIGLFDQLFTGPNALLATIFLGNILLPVGLYLFFETLFSKKIAILSAVVALFLPARMLVVRGVGSTEPLFMFFVLMSLVFHVRGKDFISGMWGALAVLTRAPGILLFLGYFVNLCYHYKFELKRVARSVLPYAVMPIALLALWGFYGYRYGDFFAYFNSGDNIHLFFPPFQIFSGSQAWSGGMWLEDVIYVYLIFTVGCLLFYRNYRDKVGAGGIFAFIYLISVFFVAHRDIARYSLPLAPFVVAGYFRYLERHERWVKVVLAVLIVPIYLYGWQFILQNVQPINDWTPLL